MFRGILLLMVSTIIGGQENSIVVIDSEKNAYTQTRPNVFKAPKDQENRIPCRRRLYASEFVFSAITTAGGFTVMTVGFASKSFASMVPAGAGIMIVGGIGCAYGYCKLRKKCNEQHNAISELIEVEKI